MTTRVTCTNPDGGFILGTPVAHNESIEVDDEIASVLDPDVWKIPKTKHTEPTTDDDKEKGQ